MCCFCHPAPTLLSPDTLVFHQGTTLSHSVCMFHLHQEWTCDSVLTIWSIAFSWPWWLVEAWAHGSIRSIEIPAVIIKRWALSFTAFEPGRMQVQSVWQQSCHHEEPWQQSCHHEEPERQGVAIWYHWPLYIAKPEINITLNFFAMWPIKASLSWLSSITSLLPHKHQLSSYENIHSISREWTVPCLCPSCQATWKLVKDSGYSSIGQTRRFREWGQITVPRRKQPGILLDTQVCLLHSFV